MKFEYEKLSGLLRKPADNPDVISLIGRRPEEIERSAYLGYATIKSDGVSVMFVEAPWAIPQNEITDPKALYLSTFPFHRQGHEGHSQYSGKFPNGIVFGDTRSEVIAKLGEPIATGGGGHSTLLQTTIPKWVRYKFGGAIFQIQLDERDTTEMVSLYVEDQKLAK